MASLAGLLIGRGRKSQISGDFRDKLAEKSANFAVISQEFSGQTSPKRIRKKKANFVVIFKANFARN